MSIKKNYIYNTINQLLTMVVSIITVPYVSRILGATNIGIYSYVYSIVSYFVMFITLGLNNYGNREIAKVRDDKRKFSETFFSIYIMQLICGVVIFVIYIIYISLFIKENILIFYIQIIYIFSAIIDINWAMYGMEVFKITAVRNMVITLLNFIAILLFVTDINSLSIYTFILAVGVFANQIVAWLYIRNKVYSVKISKSQVIAHLKPNLILFIPIISISLYKVMDKIMLGNMVSMSQVGFYESSEKIVRIPTILVSSLGTVMLPRMSNIYACNNLERGEVYIQKSIDIAIILSSSLCFGIMAVSKEFVPLFYGTGYEICVYLYLVLLPSCIFLAFSSVIRTQFLIPTSRDKIFIKAVIIGAILNVVINFMLIPKMMSIGAAIGTLFAEATVCISQLIDVRTVLPIKKYVSRVLPFIINGIIMFLIVYTVKLPFNNLMSLFLKIILGIFLYVLGLVLIIWRKKDRYKFELTQIASNNKRKKN